METQVVSQKDVAVEHVIANNKTEYIFSPDHPGELSKWLFIGFAVSFVITFCVSFVYISKIKTFFESKCCKKTPIDMSDFYRGDAENDELYVNPMEQAEDEFSTPANLSQGCKDSKTLFATPKDNPNNPFTMAANTKEMPPGAIAKV